MLRLNNYFLIFISVLLAFNLFRSAPSCFQEKDDRPFNNSAKPPRKYLSRPTKKTLLPTRMIVVTGLESSGTTMVQETLAEAVGAPREAGFEMFSHDYSVRVQHISLPTGWFDEKDPQADFPLSIESVFYPFECSLRPSYRTISQRPTPSTRACQAVYGPHMIHRPGRFFTNITSHVRFYQERGVIVQTVLVVRDPVMHFRGILKKHATNDTEAYRQYQTGRLILQEALDRLNPVVVSYETLMTLRMPYLEEIYRMLDIDSTYEPEFINGNLQYIPEGSELTYLAEELEQDTGTPRHVVP